MQAQKNGARREVRHLAYFCSRAFAVAVLVDLVIVLGGLPQHRPSGLVCVVVLLATAMVLRLWSRCGRSSDAP